MGLLRTCSVCLAGRSGARTLWLAAARGWDDVVAAMLNAGAKEHVNYIPIQGEGVSREPPLAAAVRNGHTGTTKLLIDARAIVDKPRPVNHQTPLMVAAQNGNLWATRELLKAGADPTLKDSSEQTATDLAKLALINVPVYKETPDFAQRKLFMCSALLEASERRGHQNLPTDGDLADLADAHYLLEGPLCLGGVRG